MRSFAFFALAASVSAAAVTYPAETPAYPAETPAYPEETPAYPEETPAYPVETPAYPVETPVKPTEKYPEEYPATSETAEYPVETYPAETPEHTAEYPAEPTTYEVTTIKTVDCPEPTTYSHGSYVVTVTASTVLTYSEVIVSTKTPEPAKPTHAYPTETEHVPEHSEAPPAPPAHTPVAPYPSSNGTVPTAPHPTGSAPATPVTSTPAQFTGAATQATVGLFAIVGAGMVLLDVDVEQTLTTDCGLQSSK